MKKFFSTIMMLVLLVQVSLQGVVTAQDAVGGQTNAGDAPVVGEAQPEGETGDEETQNEGELPETGSGESGDINDPLSSGEEELPENQDEGDLPETGDGSADSNPPSTGGEVENPVTEPENLEEEEEDLEMDWEFGPEFGFKLMSFPEIRGLSNDPEFETRWDNAEACDTENPEPGCVIDPTWSTGSFDSPGDVELRKLVTQTSNPGEYQIDIAVRGKEVITTGEVEKDVCAVVVFDISRSMYGQKLASAASGAKAFANSLLNKNNKAKIGLVTFAKTATIKRELTGENLDNVIFEIDNGTNIHDGLIKAGNMLSTSSCDNANKYIVLMSDGDPNFYMLNGEPKFGGATEAGNAAIEEAESLKMIGIEIFSVGYKVKVNGLAEQILKAIASSPVDEHYFAADTSTIAEAFENIATVVNIANAGTNVQIVDNLGTSITLVEAGTNSTGFATITEDWTVHSFLIRINPEQEGEQATNAGVTLTYTGYEGNLQTLSLPVENTAKIYRELPACSGEKPTGDNIVYGAEKFPQTRENGVLTPVSKTWTLNNGEGDLEACEWRCKGGYTLEGGQCINEKEVSCSTEGIPANTSYTPGNVTVTWDATNNKWSDPAQCEWECEDGYHQEGEACVSDSNTETGTCSGDIPNHATAISGHGTFVKTWSGTGYLPGSMNWTYGANECGFECSNANYYWNGEACVPESSGGGGGGGGGGGRTAKDNCPDGDYSPSYYDGICGTPPEDIEEVELGGEVNDCSIEGSPYSDEENISYLYACQNDITTIKDINEARLEDHLTRAEMAKIVTKFVTSKLNKTPNIEKDCSLFDESMAHYNQEMRDYMTWSCQLDIMGVHPNYSPLSDFMPDKYVSRAEFGTILSRILWGSAYEGTDQEWYQTHLSALKEKGIMNNIDPTIVEKRSRVFMMIYRAAKALNLVK